MTIEGNFSIFDLFDRMLGHLSAVDAITVCFSKLQEAELAEAVLVAVEEDEEKTTGVQSTWLSNLAKVIDPVWTVI